MHELKTGLYADKFARFWIFPESFYKSFVLQMTLIHSTIGGTLVSCAISKNTKTCESG